MGMRSCVLYKEVSKIILCKTNPTHIIKCLQAYHIAILYISAYALNITLLTKAKNWSLLYIGKLDTLTQIDSYGLRNVLQPSIYIRICAMFCC